MFKTRSFVLLVQRLHFYLFFEKNVSLNVSRKFQIESVAFLGYFDSGKIQMRYI